MVIFVQCIILSGRLLMISYHKFDIIVYDQLVEMMQALRSTYLTPFLKTFYTHLDASIKTVETGFNHYASMVDFPAFCLLYAIILIWFLRRLNRRPIFRPQNWELVDWKTKVKKQFMTFLLSLPILKQITQKKFNEGLMKLEQELLKDLQKNRDPLKARKLPLQGMKKQNLQSRIHKWTQSQQKRMFTGHLSGMIYIEAGEFYKEVSDFGAKFLYQNPLHIDAYKQLGKIQAELLRMTNNVISKKRAYGVVTSGGSQSLIMSLYAYKKFYKKSKPNVVVPVSIHAAVDKGAMYFNIELRKARLNENFQADVNHMQSLIDSNTIAIYGSYPNYPQGIIDPVHEIAKLGKKYNIGCHVDGCLGGFVAGFLKQHQNKFSLDVEGVTSMSIDHHKYGLGPKGVSAVFFKTEELRHSMYYVYTDWVGGIYATPSIFGSRSGFASAGAWYALTHVGRKQYLDNALEVSDTVKTVAKQLNEIEGVKVMGKPQLCVLAFDTVGVSVYNLASHLQKEKGWHFASLHLPKAVHMCVTLANCENIRQNLAKDVAEGMQLMKKKGDSKESSNAAVYGASASLPSAEMGEEMLRSIMKMCFK